MSNILLTLICLAIPLTHAADLYCNFTDDVCNFDHITNVTSENEPIAVIGKTSDYISPMTSSVYFSMTSQFDYFPTMIFQIFTNLHYVNADNCTLRYLVTDALNYCDNLQSFGGMNLKFTHLPYGFARNCHQLYSLTFGMGEIVTLDPNALEGLTSLNQLSIIYNKILCIPLGFFTPVASNIRNVDFSYNQIYALDSDTFKGLSMLTWASVNTNNLSYVPNLNTIGTGNGNDWLAISMMDNPMIAINPDMIPTYYSSRTPPTTDFIPNYNLGFGGEVQPSCFHDNNRMILQADTWNSTYADAFDACYRNWPQYSSNIFSCPRDDSVTTTTTTTNAPPVFGSCASDKICRYYLDHLDQYTCVLDGVDGVLTSISGSHISPLFTNANVTRVYFTNSYLSRVPAVVVQTFPNLEFLSVAHCSMGMIIDTSIPNCGSISFLDVSYNEIFHVTGGAFKNCQNLQTIDFTGNPIEALDTNIFVQDPSLKRVIFNNNSP